MPKSKEFSKPHAAMQTEETPSIVSQIPKEHMGAAIRELVEIGKARRAKKEASPDPHRQLDDGVMQEIFRRQAEAKAKGTSHSKASEFEIPMGSPNTLFNKKT